MDISVPYGTHQILPKPFTNPFLPRRSKNTLLQFVH
jgi:hypothetical protein